MRVEFANFFSANPNQVSMLKNDMKNMLTVATMAPVTPADLYPMKVAEIVTGPGVI